MPDQVHEAFPSSDSKRTVLSPSTSNRPKSHSTLPASPVRDLNQEIRLAQLQKEKLALELEVLRLRHAPIVSPDGEVDDNLKSSKPVDNTKMKRAMDWPHEIAPGTSNSIDYDKLELPQIVMGFLAMIKPYDTAKKSTMFDYLELLMLKALSYSWQIGFILVVGIHATFTCFQHLRPRNRGFLHKTEIASISITWNRGKSGDIHTYIHTYKLTYIRISEIKLVLTQETQAGHVLNRN